MFHPVEQEQYITNWKYLVIHQDITIYHGQHKLINCKAEIRICDPLILKDFRFSVSFVHLISITYMYTLNPLVVNVFCDISNSLYRGSRSWHVSLCLLSSPTRQNLPVCSDSPWLNSYHFFLSPQAPFLPLSQIYGHGTI